MANPGARLFQAPPPNPLPSGGGPGRLTRLARLWWSFRLESLLLAAAWYLAAVLAANLPHVWPLLFLVLVGLVLAVGPIRRRLFKALVRSRLRRRFMRSVRHAGLANHNDRVPTPVKLTATPAGELIRVRIPYGSHAGELEEAADAMAAVLEAREVRIARDPANARFADVAVIRRDPFARTGPLRWPHADAERLSLWDPIPLGVGEDGDPISVCVVERHVLVAGEPGGGKSVAASQIVATAALDPTVHLTLFDGKLVELSIFRGCADRFVGPDLADAIDALGELRDDMEARYRSLLERQRRKISPDDDFPLRLVVVDELAFYTAAGGKQAAEFSGLLRDLVARGRAAGIVVLAATQKPSSDIVPTALRDLFGIRWALRCSTRDASDTILGSGWASQGYSAASVAAAARGVGFLLAEGAVPLRLRSYYLSDDDLIAIAARGEALRAAARSAGA